MPFQPTMLCYKYLPAIYSYEIILYAFPIKPSDEPFHMFILLLMFARLSSTYNSLAPTLSISASSLWLVRFRLSMYVGCVPQQSSSKQNGDISAWFTTGIVMPFSVHSTIIITNDSLTRQEVIMYLLINTLYGIEVSYVYPVTWMISLLLLHLTLAPPWYHAITAISL